MASPHADHAQVFPARSTISRESRFADFQSSCASFVVIRGSSCEILAALRPVTISTAYHVRAVSSSCFRGCVGSPGAHSVASSGFFPSLDAHKAGALFIGFRSQLRHFQKLRNGLTNVPFSSRYDHNIFGNGSCSHRRHIPAADAEAVFKSTPTRFTQSSTT